MDGNVVVNLHLALANGVLLSIAKKKTVKEIRGHLTKLYEAKLLQKIFLQRNYILCV